jgi:hypothetical protein
MKNKSPNQYQKMWRTLVRVTAKNSEGVYLSVPAVSASLETFCPRKAIPPFIFEGMKEDKRCHVGCNIGAENMADLCFDNWENE